MKSKTANPYFHILFWLVVAAIFIIVFGKKWQNGIQAFYFTSMFLPVIMATSYVFNYYLVPTYLLKRKYFWFGLYFYYTLVISLFLEMLVLIFSFIYLANFELENFRLSSTDVLLLAVVMYLVVFLGSFLLMVQQLFNSNQELEKLRIEKKKMDKPFLELVSNRQLVRILYADIIYIESLSDYVKVHSGNENEIVSKEKISALAEKLPEQFLRIHRSFIVNTEKVTRFNANEVDLNGVQLNIGRSFKKPVSTVLKSI